MCLGIPGRVVSMVEGYGDQLALVDVEGLARQVNVGMLDESPAPGQWVLIHMGFAVELTDKDGADAAMSGLEMMGNPRDGTARDEEPSPEVEAAS
ncbi:MAG: HypC/HybG/HupF family hydrogenase formation chaperone [Sporichthyaceae bacterium]